jgi:hypothetical protein
MDVPIDAKVLCADGPGGQSTRVSVNPLTRKVTHLVAREGGLRQTERLVPIGRVRGTADDLIHLDCTRQELGRMEPLIETGLVWADIPELNELPPYHLHPYAAWMPSMARHGSLPRGELCIRRGAGVQAIDAGVGWIDELGVVPTSGEITHLLLREGHLRGRKEVVIPVSEIDRIEERTVYLKLYRKGVEALPLVQVRRKRK